MEAVSAVRADRGAGFWMQADALSEVHGSVLLQMREGLEGMFWRQGGVRARVYGLCGLVWTASVRFSGLI